MPRFVMANRRAGKFQKPQKEASRKAVSAALNAMPRVNIIHDTDPSDPLARRVVVFDSTAEEVESQRNGLGPDVLLEPEIVHWSDTIATMDFLQMRRVLPTAAMLPGVGTSLSVQVRGNGAALQGAEVILFLRGLGSLETKQVQITPASGQVTFSFGSFWTPSALIVVPAGGFWSVVVRAPASSATIECPPLPQASDRIGWWHQAMGVAQYQADRGRGIRVGVIDTGVGPHPNLGHVQDAGAFIDGAFSPTPGGADVDSHGTHVCGIIGARPTSASEFGGLAPGVDLLSARVFPPDRGANQADVANAIDALSRTHNVDLINMSLGADAESEIEHDAIVDALERGTLCVCAAGNSNSRPEWPGRFDEAVAVSAIGLLGWAPTGTLASIRLPAEQDRFGHDNLYHANFSCFGEEIDCAAPGVGIVSTVPARFGRPAPYASMDGTSMASPAACAVLAALLSSEPGYTALPRDQTRAEFARATLGRACRDVGLRPVFQGRGVPR